VISVNVEKLMEHDMLNSNDVKHQERKRKENLSVAPCMLAFLRSQNDEDEK